MWFKIFNASPESQTRKIPVEFWMDQKICSICPLNDRGIPILKCWIRNFVNDNGREPTVDDLSKIGWDGAHPKQPCPGRYTF